MIKSILYVDETTYSRELFEKVVVPLNYLVDAVQTGKQAMTLLDGKSYDIIVIDSILPDMTGIEIARHILATNPDFPILLLSANGNERLVVEAFTLGITYYLAKDSDNLYLELIPSVLENFTKAIDLKTRQSATEIALMRSEKRYRELMKSAPVCIHEIDLEGKLVSMNPAGLKMMNVGAESEIYGIDYIDIVINDDKENVSRLLELAKKGVGAKFEFRGIIDSDIFHFSSFFEPILDDDLNVVRLMGVTENITDANRARESLLEAKEQADTYLNITEAIIVALDTEGLVTAINRRGCEVLGYEQSEIVQKNWLDLVIPNDQKDLMKNNTSKYYENKIITKSGAIRCISWHNISLKDAENNIISCLSSGQDVTDRVNLEAQLRQSQKVEAIGHLTGGIAHDFNNLLAIMMGNAEMLGRILAEDSAEEMYNNEILETIERASAMTGRLLNFSRQQASVPVTIDVSKLVDSIAKILQRVLGEEIELRVEVDPDLWFSNIDPNQLENAIVNLALNARDAMVKGGVLTISLTNAVLLESSVKRQTETTAGDYIKIGVTDDGTGISPEITDKIFNPFFTTKGIGDGSGLGLSMVLGFVKQSNGQISVESKLEEGTCIDFYLPRSMQVPIAEEVGETSVTHSQGSERILIVEDDESVRKIPATLLRELGYEVTEVGNGADAITELKGALAFHLLFTDIVLPGNMNGLEISEQAQILQPDIKIVFSTGYAENKITTQLETDPEIILLKKPYRQNELISKIQMALQ